MPGCGRDGLGRQTVNVYPNDVQVLSVQRQAGSDSELKHGGWSARLLFMALKFMMLVEGEMEGNSSAHQLSGACGDAGEEDCYADRKR